MQGAALLAPGATERVHGAPLPRLRANPDDHASRVLRPVRGDGSSPTPPPLTFLLTLRVHGAYIVPMNALLRSMHQERVEREASEARSLPYVLTGTGYFIWCLCGRCNRHTKPALSPEGYVKTVSQERATIITALCGACNSCTPVVYVKNGHKRGPKGRCITACLEGKSTCDCQCNGRCHGAGVCYCE